MDTIDKVLLEWSLKTDKGYPDVNSKEDMDLFESMFGFRLNEEEVNEIEDIRKNLFNILQNINDPSELAKISKYASSLGFSKSIDSHLESKNLSRKDIVFFKSLLSDIGKTGSFADIVKNPPNLKIDFDKKTGIGTGNYFNQIKGFEDSELKDLYFDMKDSIKGTVSMGPGEAFLSIFFDNVSKVEGGGDLKIGEQDVELKSRTGSTGALVAPSYVVRGKSVGIKNDLVSLVKKFNLEPEQEKDLVDYITPKGTAWTDKINIIYQKLIQAGIDAKKASSELSKEVSTWYKKKLPLDISAFFSDQEFKSKEFVISLAKQLARDYFKEHKFDAFMISDNIGNFKYYSGNQFIDAMGDGITVAKPSDLIPRVKLS
jgi:hypothetical protein